MILDTSALSKEDGIYFTLRNIYSKQGYSRYRLKKFEEYSLYLENMSFLPSQSIIAFNDADGRLIALKPDVTLSIAKNTKATSQNPEKLYYRESVYRMDKRTREYREISQAGIEIIGFSDSYSTLEVILLAAQSLQAVDGDFVLNISHMGFIRGMLSDFNTENREIAEKITACLSAKNCHDLAEYAAMAGIPGVKINTLTQLISSKASFKDTIEIAKGLISGNNTRQAVAELEEIYDVIKDTPYADKIIPDFSIVADMSYYNGIILRGYVRGVPKAVLSGGRYDNLLARFGKNTGAMGFAINLSEIGAYYSAKTQYDADILLIYNQSHRPRDVLQRVNELQKNGSSVLALQTIPEGKRFKQIVYM